MSADLPPVLILHNVPDVMNDEASFAESDAGVLAEVQAVADSLARLAIPHRIAGVRCLAEVSLALAAHREPIVFNLVEEFRAGVGSPDAVPAVCQAFGRSVTGSDSTALAMTLDKARSKALLAAAGLPVPRGVVVERGQRIPRSQLPKGPWIVKPVAADASEGIDDRSVVDRAGKKLAEAVRRIHDEFGQSAIIEQFVRGRELNVSVIERDGVAEVLPLAEIDFSAFDDSRPRIVGYDAKWRSDSFEYNNTPRIIPAPLKAAQARRVRQCALDAFRVMGCRDYARIDFRLSPRGEPCVIEVNANPDIAPDAGLAAALEATAISYDDFVRTMVTNAAGRLPYPVATVTTDDEQPVGDNGSPAKPSDERPAAPDVTIRYTRRGDREGIREFLIATNFFRPDEIEVALEVLDDAIAQGPAGHYQSFTAVAGDQPVGWVCSGPTPCTVATWDVYWLAVDPRVQSRGIGRALMVAAESLIAQRHGTLSIVETNGRPEYHPTRAFYLRVGYEEAARVTDFYAPGDDKVIYTKRITPHM